MEENTNKAQEPKVKKCSTRCGNNATQFCKDCKGAYCQECCEKRHSVKKRKDHCITSIDQKLPVNSDPTGSKQDHSLNKLDSTGKAPIVSGLKESKQDRKSVTLQWDPVQCDFAEMDFVVQTMADNDSATAKSFQVPHNETSLRVLIDENWKQLVCTVQCTAGDHLEDVKCTPLIIELIGDPQVILCDVKKNCSQEIYERVQQVFKQQKLELNLYCCNVDNSSAIAVAKLFPHLKRLQELNFQRNYIEDAGAIAIANSVSKLTQLRRLWVHNNQFGDIGAIAIANSISKLAQLQVMCLDGNVIGDSGATAVADSVTKLTQLKKLYLLDNNISQPVQQQLLQQFGDKLYIPNPYE